MEFDHIQQKLEDICNFRKNIVRSSEKIQRKISTVKNLFIKSYKPINLNAYCDCNLKSSQYNLSMNNSFSLQKNSHIRNNNIATNAQKIKRENDLLLKNYLTAQLISNKQNKITNQQSNQEINKNQFKFRYNQQTPFRKIKLINQSDKSNPQKYLSHSKSTVKRQKNTRNSLKQKDTNIPHEFNTPNNKEQQYVQKTEQQVLLQKYLKSQRRQNNRTAYDNRFNSTKASQRQQKRNSMSVNKSKSKSAKKRTSNVKTLQKSFLDMKKNFNAQLQKLQSKKKPSPQQQTAPKSYRHHKQQMIKRIQKRINLSQNIFQDSQLRNNLHQINHLQNTYNKETKQRKQIIQKIVDIPQFTKRFGKVFYL